MSHTYCRPDAWDLARFPVTVRFLDVQWRHTLHLCEPCQCGAGIPPPAGTDDSKLLTMSTLNEEGVMHVKQVACDRLLSSRVENKLQVISAVHVSAVHVLTGGSPFRPSTKRSQRRVAYLTCTPKLRP